MIPNPDFKVTPLFDVASQKWYEMQTQNTNRGLHMVSFRMTLIDLE